jgi:uncharacterized protein
MGENVLQQEKIKLEIAGVIATDKTDENSEQFFAVILTNAAKNRKLPILIEADSAKNIYLLLEKTTETVTPKIHAVLNNLINTFEYEVEEVFIYSTYNEIFISKIIIRKNENEIAIEARTTDALAIALIANAPIYTTTKILASSGMNNE